MWSEKAALIRPHPPLPCVCFSALRGLPRSSMRPCGPPLTLPPLPPLHLQVSLRLIVSSRSWRRRSRATLCSCWRRRRCRGSIYPRCGYEWGGYTRQKYGYKPGGEDRMDGSTFRALKGAVTLQLLCSEGGSYELCTTRLARFFLPYPLTPHPRTRYGATAMLRSSRCQPAALAPAPTARRSTRADSWGAMTPMHSSHACDRPSRTRR